MKEEGRKKFLNTEKNEERKMEGKEFKIKKPIF